MDITKRNSPTVRRGKKLLVIKGMTLFYLCFIIWIAINTILYLTVPQNILFLTINHWRSTPADILFTAITYLGSGLVIVPIGILCCMNKKSLLGPDLILSFVVAGLLTLALKHSFNLLRPAASFSDPSLVKTASWVTLYYKYSFPSGHTTAAFAAATTACWFLHRKRWVVILCFATACLIAYSRVYLGEHFVEDVWVGSIVGVTVSTVCLAVQTRTSFHFGNAKRGSLTRPVT